MLCCPLRKCWSCEWRRCKCCRRRRMINNNMGASVDSESKRTDVENRPIDDATEILPHLYLGGLGNRNSRFLTEKKITSIINASNMDPKKITGCSQPYDIEELIVPLWDADVSSINQFFDQAGAMIDKAEKSKGVILVHCAAGISRSTTLVLAYLMKYKNMSLKDAYILVKSKRKVVRPNLGFWGQLVDFEKEVFGKNSVQMIEESFAQAEPNEHTRLIPDIYKAGAVA